MTKPSFNLEELNAMIADGIAKAMAATAAEREANKKTRAKSGRKPQSEEQKAKNRAKIEGETVANFQKAGYTDVQPRVNVLTYNKWLEKGRRVKKNEKAIKCGSFGLFHVNQTEPIIPPGTVH